MTQPLRFGTYVEFQCPPGKDHAELIEEVIQLGQHGRLVDVQAQTVPGERQAERNIDLFVGLHIDFVHMRGQNPGPHGVDGLTMDLHQPVVH